MSASRKDHCRSSTDGREVVPERRDRPMSVTTIEMSRAPSAVATFRTDIGVAGWASAGEDRILVRPDLGLYGVFDGVGLSGRGGLAAQAAVVAVERTLEAGLAQCHSKTTSGGCSCQ